MFGKKKQQKTSIEQAKDPMVPVRASKEGKRRSLRVTVFPKAGGSPYFADVEPDDQGTFDLGDKQTYHVVKGSVWEEDGLLRAVVNEGSPNTINVFALTGDDSMNPIALHGIASNNLWIQLDTLAKRKSVWKSAGTWGVMILGVVLCLLILWNVKTTGDGFDNLTSGLEALRASQGAPATPAAQAGHQNIAPGALFLNFGHFGG